MGGRGMAKDARKVAMYLLKQLCDLLRQDSGMQFEVNRYGVVGWECVQGRAKKAEDQRFRKWADQMKYRIRQLKTCFLFPIPTEFMKKFGEYNLSSTIP